VRSLAAPAASWTERNIYEQFVQKKAACLPQLSQTADETAK
jgi:hypothetical protein